MTLKFRDLAALQADLAQGLGRALAAGGRLSFEDASAAAAEVVAGRALPTAAATALGDGPVATLVSFDADRIQRWVFASERLPVVRGASKSLEDLNEAVRERSAEIEGIAGVVYSAGGGGTLFAPALDGEGRGRLAGRVRGWLEPQCPGLTFTVVTEPLFARDLRPAPEAPPVTAEPLSPLERFARVEGVAGALTRLQIGLRRAKDEAPRARLAPLEFRPGDAAERCPSCGQRPPGKGPVTGDGPEFWCAWCREMRERTRAVEPVRTFADLAGALPGKRAYLAFLAIDGNGLGSVLQGVRSLLQLRAFSEATTAIYAAARDQAAAALPKTGLKKGWQPEDALLSLLSGGDEVTLVLPAAAGPRAAVEVLREVERGFAEAAAPGGLLAEAFAGAPRLLARLARAGAGGGLVAAREHYPVRLLRRYATELQGRAKRWCALQPGDRRSALAWTLLTDSSPLPDPGAVGDGAGEWAPDDFATLLDEAAAAARHGLPQAAVQRLLGEVGREERSLTVLGEGDGRRKVAVALAANFFRYQLARNRPLAAWWDEVRPAGGESDPVAAWLGAAAGKWLPALADLMALGPVPLDEGEGGR